MKAPPKRTYQQEARAQVTEANTQSVVDATVALIKKVRRLSEITLDDIARESGITVRTVLRRFGSRDGGLDAAFAQLSKEVEAARAPSEAGDVNRALTNLLAQYEQMGDLNIRALEEEDQFPSLHELLEGGRRYHREWLVHVFGPELGHLSRAERELAIASLYVATDVYVWKLLRRDMKLGKRDTSRVFMVLVRGALNLWLR